jgi:hypothetical protein
MLGRVAVFFDRVLRSPHQISPDGVPIHHGIWHYDYAAYSVQGFLGNVVKLHKCGVYLSKESRDRVRRFAYVAAFLGAPSGFRIPFNLQGRSGGISNISDMTAHALWAASMLGADDDPLAPDPVSAGLLRGLFPDHALAKQFPGINPNLAPLQGQLSINRGAAAARRHGKWLLCIGGLSPYTRKHEIYAWTQHNNESFFVRRGGIVITGPGSAEAPELGYALSDGFDWSMIPGATTEIRTSVEMFTRKRNTFVYNTGAAAAIDLDGCGAWMLDQTTGPGPSFRKSAFSFGGRTTVVTTGVRRDAPKEKRPRVTGIPPSHPDARVVTTLFQWPAENGSHILRGGDANRGAWLTDRHGHAYVVHPSPATELHAETRKQARILFRDKFLRDPKENPIDWKKWTVFGKSLWNANLEEIGKYYVPRSGTFQIAWLEHKLTDGSPEAACVFTIVPGAGAEQARKFLEGLRGPKPPVRVLAANNHVHAVADSATGIIGVCVFDPAAALPEGLPVRRVNAPCALLLRPQGDELAVAAVMAAGSEPRQLIIEIAGNWKVKHGKSNHTNKSPVHLRNHGDTTTLEIPVSIPLPVRVSLATK